MAVPNMGKAIRLNAANLALAITKTSPGVYVLGEMAQNNKVNARYVGRADSDVRGRLGDHVGKYDYFLFCYEGSAQAAFYSECELFHEYNPSDNKIHPDRPKNSNWKCPRCSVFG